MRRRITWDTYVVVLSGTEDTYSGTQSVAYSLCRISLNSFTISKFARVHAVRRKLFEYPSRSDIQADRFHLGFAPSLSREQASPTLLPTHVAFFLNNLFPSCSVFKKTVQGPPHKSRHFCQFHTLGWDVQKPLASDLLGVFEFRNRDSNGYLLRITANT